MMDALAEALKESSKERKPMIKMTEFAKRRKTFMQKMGSSGIAIIPAAPIARRNADSDYPYRQSSDLYYLTGFQEPESVAILMPKRAEGEFILFNRIRDREREIWDGIRAGQDGAKKLYGANDAYPITDFEKILPQLLEGRKEIYYTLGIDRLCDKMVLDAINTLRGKIRNGLQSPLTFVDVTDTLHEMRLIKSESEINIMRKAAQISAAAHKRAISICQPGMNELELEAEIVYEFMRQGGRFPAYTPIVGSGRNSCVLHYIDNNQPINSGDLVLIDAGCEYQYYASDITRTFPANGKFSEDQRKIYELVLSAQTAALKKVKPGIEFIALQNIIVEIMTAGLLELGILKGKLSDLIDKKAYFPFYMHKSGHWLGLDTHDVGRYKINDRWRKLEPGMVLTVEPGIYISEEIAGVNKRWHNIGVRIEDDVVVTEKGCEILSKDVPKSIADIENLMLC